MNGAIDEARVYNRPLDDTEVLKLYKNSLIKVVTPNGGENWLAGTQHDIPWQVNSTIDSIRIEYSNDNGDNWFLVVDSIPAIGYSFAWILPNDISENCKVRISFIADPEVSDESDFCFKISSAFNLKVFLEGPFFGTQMTPFLNIFGYLPLSQPYNKPPWNYNGTESVTSIPNSDVIDWALVELRETTGDASTATSDSVVARQAAFLLKDGTILAGMVLVLCGFLWM
ncbi:MAG: hypothetical protein ISS18_12065 [Bacteroidales bacterium]|nr:hypothetical protein [Bacteroidales bacterium]